MYENLDGPQSNALTDAIVNRVNYVSPLGGHRVDVSGDCAVYSICGLKILSNDGKLFELAPEEFFDRYDFNMKMNELIDRLVPEFPPRVWKYGFGWAILNDGDNVEILHPFPLRIDIASGLVMNKISPVLYFEHLYFDWTQGRISVIANIMKTILRMKWVPPAGIIARTQQKIIGRLRKSYSYYDEQIIAHGLAIFNIPEDQHSKMLGYFNEEIHNKEPLSVDRFYEAAKGLDLPEGHIVRKMLEIAEGELIKRKLVGT